MLKRKIEDSPGLQVRLLINEDTLDGETKDWLKNLLSASGNVKVKLWEKNGDKAYQKLHAKATICDENVIMGSPNWSASSCEVSPASTT